MMSNEDRARMGGAARAMALTEEERRAIASAAGKARWARMSPAERTRVAKKLNRAKAAKRERAA